MRVTRKVEICRRNHDCGSAKHVAIMRVTRKVEKAIETMIADCNHEGDT